MDNINSTNGQKENEEAEEKRRPIYSWRDIFAFCIAMYRVLIPQLLLTLLAVVIFIYLIFFLWLA